jgi:hypothetical protein
MKTFLPQDWESRLMVTLPDDLVVLIRAALFVKVAALLNEHCPFQPGLTVRDSHFVMVAYDNLDDRPLTLNSLFAHFRRGDDSPKPTTLDLFCEKFAPARPQQDLLSQPFANSVVEPGLYLVPVNYQFANFDFDDQVAKVPKGYQVSSSALRALARVQHQLKANSPLGGKHQTSVFGRTCDCTKDGSPVMVEDQPCGCFSIVAGNVYANPDVGIALHRRIELG